MEVPLFVINEVIGRSYFGVSEEGKLGEEWEREGGYMGWDDGRDEG